MIYEDMLKGVLGKVEGCPTSEAVDAMRNTCMEFATETRCLLTDSTTATTGTLGSLDLTLQVLDIIDASIDGRPVCVTYVNDTALTELRAPDYGLTFSDPSVVTLTPTPPAAVNLRLVRVIAPGPESTEVPDVLWLRHSEALKHGCLARLMAAPGQPWANAPLAGYHDTKYQRAIEAAAAEHSVNRKQTGRRLRVKAI
jgi:hypothetical protein